jgi:hypothetical protein
VASEATFRIATPPRSVDGIFGFADDTVRAIEYRRGRGRWTSVPVANNVFVALDAHAQGTFRHPARWQPIVQVRAVTRSGDRLPVPFVAGFASYAGGVPRGPSYLAVSPAKPDDVPGPTALTRRVEDGTVGWLVRGEKRGTAWRPTARVFSAPGRLLRSRAVKPDPDDPFRVGLFLVQPDPVTAQRIGSRAPIVCTAILRPLGGTGEGSCPVGPRQPDRGVLSDAVLWPEGFGFGQQTHLMGAVPDGVASLRLFLASGRVIPVALRDNAYGVSAPSSQLPAKLVAYDGAGHVVGLAMFLGPARPTPCPAVSVWARPRLPATKPYQRLDLGALSLDGSPIFGRSPAEVEAALGKPARGSASSVSNGHAEPTFFYGGVLPSGAELAVHFGWHQKRLRADRMDFHGRGLVEKRLGRVLNGQPQALERGIARTYPTLLRRSYEYGALPAGLPGPLGPQGCAGEFRDPRGVVRVTFGVDPRSGRPYLSLWHPY